MSLSSRRAEQRPPGWLPPLKVPYDREARAKESLPGVVAQGVDPTPLIPCLKCRRSLPPLSFDGPAGAVPCKYCEEAYRSSAAIDREAERFKDKVANVLDEIGSPASSVPDLEVMLGDLFQAAGGPRRFSRQLWEALDKNLSLPKPPMSAVNAQINILRLKLHVEEKKQRKEAAEMTDEQIRREQELMLLQLIVDAGNDESRRRQLEATLKLGGMRLIGLDEAADRVRRLCETPVDAEFSATPEEEQEPE